MATVCWEESGIPGPVSTVYSTPSPNTFVSSAVTVSLSLSSFLTTSLAGTIVPALLW
uniref:Uncharacterized protein n=1 Tax=Anguilla anguilla TaxID=7936 RepID=A0A0E9PJ51_ANGAN